MGYAMDLDVRHLIDTLGLIPHPSEGGFFRETYRSSTSLPDSVGGHDGPRAASTAIYYLLTPETFSAMHRLSSDEVFHFYLGDPVEQLHLFPDGTSEIAVIGADIAQGERPQLLVQKGVWQGARLVRGGRFALLGCTVAPGFDFADYEHGERAALAAAWPDRALMIAALTA
jgi:predicted cupin superfamily sugar epimerase